MPVVLKNILKHYNDLKVLDNFSIELEDNKTSVILGPSGCGKTTLLNIISGIKTKDSGSISGVENKRFSYVFQEPNLIEWKTVYENLHFVLEDIYSKEESKKIIDKYLSLVGLGEFSDYYPNKLSGGMKQRVNIARAFCYPSDIILMDEPFRGLDLNLKLSLIKEFLNILENENKTIIFVTHDIDEAVLLGDNIFVLDNNPCNILDQFSITIPKSERKFRDIRFNYIYDKLLK